MKSLMNTHVSVRSMAAPGLLRAPPPSVCRPFELHSGSSVKYRCLFSHPEKLLLRYRFQLYR